MKNTVNQVAYLFIHIECAPRKCSQTKKKIKIYGQKCKIDVMKKSLDHPASAG